jgi:hypothetical protein
MRAGASVRTGHSGKQPAELFFQVLLDEVVPTRKIAQPDSTLVKALARAWRWQRMLQCGEYGTLAELADAEGIRLSYVCPVVRPTLLPPEIVDRILDGRMTTGLARFLKPFSVGWERQREQFC